MAVYEINDLLRIIPAFVKIFDYGVLYKLIDPLRQIRDNGCRQLVRRQFSSENVELQRTVERNLPCHQLIEDDSK